MLWYEWKVTSASTSFGRHCFSKPKLWTESLQSTAVKKSSAIKTKHKAPPLPVGIPVAEYDVQYVKLLCSHRTTHWFCIEDLRTVERNNWICDDQKYSQDRWCTNMQQHLSHYNELVQENRHRNYLAGEEKWFFQCELNILLWSPLDRLQAEEWTVLSAVNHVLNCRV